MADGESGSGCATPWWSGGTISPEVEVDDHGRDVVGVEGAVAIRVRRIERGLEIGVAEVDVGPAPAATAALLGDQRRLERDVTCEQAEAGVRLRGSVLATAPARGGRGGLAVDRDGCGLAGEAVAQRGETCRDRRDRGGRDDEDAEEREQHEEQAGDDRVRGRDHRRGRQPADPAAAGLHGGAAVGGERGAVQDVDQAARGQDQRAPADRDATRGRALVRVTQHAPGEAEQQEREDPVEGAHGAGDHGADEAAEPGRDVPPHGERDEHGEADEEEAQTIAAVRRVELAGAAPEPADGAAEHVTDPDPDRAEHAPEGAQGPVERRGGGGLPARGRLTRRRRTGRPGRRGRACGGGTRRGRPCGLARAARRGSALASGPGSGIGRRGRTGRHDARLPTPPPPAPHATPVTALGSRVNVPVSGLPAARRHIQRGRVGVRPRRRRGRSSGGGGAGR